MIHEPYNSGLRWHKRGRLEKNWPATITTRTTVVLTVVKAMLPVGIERQDPGGGEVCRRQRYGRGEEGGWGRS